MVTIRNDIESNCPANRSPDGTGNAAAPGVDGVKNVNHLANGSRRSTMVDLKSKTFNRKCVGFLTLIVCVGVCFGIGMLFLYGHLVDRLNESAVAGTMWHDKNGNPVKPGPAPENDTPATTVGFPGTSTSTETLTGSTPRTVTPTTERGRTSTSASTSTMYPVVHSATDKPDDGFDLDSKEILKKDGGDSKIDLQIAPTSSDRNRESYDDEDDDVSSGSGDGKEEYENDQPYDGSGRRQ